MRVLTKDDILNADDLPRETIEVPEWGGSVIIRTLTGAERDEFEASRFIVKGRSVKTNLVNLRARLISMCAVDEEGNRLFTSEDVRKLGKKSAKALDRLFEAAQRLSGLTPEDIEDMTKNSESGQSEGFISD